MKFDEIIKSISKEVIDKYQGIIFSTQEDRWQLLKNIAQLKLC